MAEPAPQIAPRKTQKERRNESTGELLAAGVRILAQRGVAGLTFKSVGAHAGASHGLGQFYFKTKAKFLGAIVDKVLATHELPSPSVLKAVKADYLYKASQAYLDAARRDRPGTRALLVVLREALIDRSVRAKVSAFNARQLDRLETQIKAGIESGTIRNTNAPRAVAIALLGVLRSATELWLVDPDGIDLEQVRGEIGNLLNG